MRGARAAFTLVELLVVMGIIVVLIGLIFPSLGAVWKGGVRQRMTADLMAISTALDAYKQDWGDYPKVYANGTGSAVLTAALIGPGDNDGQVGPGWKSRVGAKTQQPYLPLEKFKLVDPLNPRTPNPNLNTAVIGDRYSNPILYYPANPAGNINVPGGYVDAAPYASQTSVLANRATPRYNANDNINKLTTVQQLRRLLGDNDGDGGINGAAESAAFTGPFLLWSAGPDEQYGLKDPTKPVSPSNRCDDVANFQRTEY